MTNGNVPSKQGEVPPFHSPPMHRWVLRSLVGLTVVICGVTAYRCWLSGKPLPAVTPTSDPIRSEVNPHGYLGPDACAACHADRVTEFRSTRHFLACVLPEANAMPEGFAPGKGAFSPRGASVRFEMTQANGEFLQTAIHNTPM